nr:uncharacterized protein LOC117217358 isoform X2 [Megalopta genalis]
MQTTNEIYRDVPCINIILRSDSTMKSTQYNCTQKDDSQNENKNQSSPQRRYEQINISTEKQFHSLPSVKAQCESTLVFNNIQTSPYMSDELPSYSIKYSNEVPDIAKNPIELVRKKLMYSDNDTMIMDTRMVSTKLTEDSNEDGRVVADVNKTEQKIADHIRYYREAAWETLPVTKLEKAPGRVYEGEITSTRSKRAEELLKKDISTFVGANSQAEHDQLGYLCSCNKYDQKYKAPFKYEKDIFDKIVSKTIDTGEKEENCCTNVDRDSINRTALNVEQELKSSINYNSMGYSKFKMGQETKYENFIEGNAVKFFTSTPKQKSAVSKDQ